MSLLILGAGRDNPELITTDQENYIYDSWDILDLTNVARIENGSNNTADEKNIVVIGQVESVDKNGYNIIPVPPNMKIKSVEIKHKKSGFSVGQNVIVFGKCGIDHKDKTVSIKAHQDFPIADQTVIDGKYFVKDNKFFVYKESELLDRYLSKGKIRYRIPKEWGRVEATYEQKKDLFSTDFYADSTANAANCYYLNALDENKTGDGEILCIFYFDYSKFIYDNDKDDREDIEKAIIENITEVKKSKITKNKSPYGTDFHNSVVTYNSYDIEFVFAPQKEGLCVLMYIYRGNQNYKQDVLCVMRSIGEYN